MFECDRCGICCMNLQKSTLFADLDRGDGICRYFDIVSRLCTVYRDRPLKCNVDKSYDAYFIEKMSREQYYQLNYEACKNLKKEGKHRCI